jgi:hypothetical protein
MPVEFFAHRPDMAGVREGNYVAMCTSNPTVVRWLSDSLEYVFKNVPHLGGVFTITASENLTNCASHGKFHDCPRCKDRSGADILAGVNAAIEAGVHRANPDAKVIVWDWGWPDAWSADIIAHLPKNVWFMSVSEWGVPLDRGGIHTTVGEYSMSAIGPGPRATDHWALARKASLKTVAKVQVNNTWECSAMPYLPVLDLVAEHAHRLASAHVDGLMLSWSLGGYPSLNLQVASQALANPNAPVDGILNQAAQDSFGPAAAPHVRRAWTLFSHAFQQYPFNAGVIYRCQVQFGPANLLYEKPTHYHATMIGFPYDDLNGWRGPYPPEVFTQQFQKMADQWNAGIDEIKQALAAADPQTRPRVQSELRLAQATGIHFRSVANQCRFVLARDELLGQINNEKRQQDRLEMQQILNDEMRLSVQLFELTRADSRIGFEASNQYYYLPQDLIEKVLNCRQLCQEFH